MKISSIYFVLLKAGVCEVAAREVLYPASINSSGESAILTPLNNHNGWVNPEDLTAMPQCIAQQDQSIWMNTMTKCTSSRCTSHFGIICTHHQWLTQLSCLSLGFSADIVKGYLPYCSRSVLAKAQLYRWIRNVTGRRWLVDVGDANELENLSPSSLTEGYAAFNVIEHAPACLTGSKSASTMEAFQYLMASCSFTSATQHTGNAARPWEYNQPLRSMIALDSETVGYDVTGHNIRYGDYFDKACFCGAFTMDPKREPCSAPGNIDLTRERLWMHATCGSTSLPVNWTDALKTTDFAYIPIEDWSWPKSVTDMPKKVIDLTDQCTTDACELDSGGYCSVRRAVDRACFCRDISYDSCGGLCKIFETRIDYVNWLHDLCGNVQDWHGLPDNWRHLATPTTLDMIPWRWTIKPFSDPNIASMTRPGSPKATETCAKTEWKLGSFAVVNIATFLAAFLGKRKDIRRIASRSLWYSYSRSWFLKGIAIATLQLLANWLNAFLVQNTLGYEGVPTIQLMLLWCSMPRLTWLAILLLGVQAPEAINFSAVASSLFAETILQIFSSYYMIMTVSYGREHDFYLGYMEKLEMSTPAQFMYAGALLWHIVAVVTVFSSIALNRNLTWLEKKMAYQWIDKSNGIEEAALTRSERGNCTGYGTLPFERHDNRVSPQASAILYAVLIISMLLSWIAQWVFWIGFIGLSLEEFCPPKLGVLTAVWIAFSLAGATVGAIH